MTSTANYPITHQGVRNLDSPRQAPIQVNVGPGERAASTVLGGLLAGFGMSRQGLGGYLLAAAGAALAYRGMTGHCSAYAAAGVNTAR
jgi:uncharacterized membrane protein